MDEPLRTLVWRLQQTRYPARNLAIFLLSIKAGLRAKEIASSLGTWSQTLKATWDQRFISETKPAKGLRVE